VAGFFTDETYELHRGTDARLLESFLRENLSSATSYRRAVGFFSSSVFEIATEEFAEFFRSHGTMELICSPVVSLEDLHALRRGLYDGSTSSRSVDDVLSRERTSSGPEVLAWAVATGRLAIRIAVVHSNPRRALYHEKIGILSPKSGGLMAFEGSANESSPGYVSNFERIAVYRSPSIRDQHPWAQWIVRDFERLWEDETPGLQVLSLHDAFKQNVFHIREESHAASALQVASMITDMSIPAEILKTPPRLQLRPYQEEAVRRWFAQQGCGMFAMATGSGKTITALAALEELYQRLGGPLVIIIIAPYLNLVDQWIAEAKQFGLDPINCSGASRDWTAAVDTALYLTQSSQRPLLSLATTNATFSGEPFQRLLAKLRVRTVIVADEVHNLGARHLRRRLPERVQLRLGLSATPERWMDEEGTAAVTDYFGSIAFSYDLEDALKGDPPTLSPYKYHPVLVELEDDETEEYLEITALLARYMNDPRDENLSDAALGLLLRRARLVACARGKLSALRDVIAPYRRTQYNLVYCGDGRVELEAISANALQDVEESPVLRQVDAVTRVLGHDLGMNVSAYTADTPKEARVEVLRDFGQGLKQALVAIRCLDEGVDIPQVRRAFILASSTNPRQFIQRRGRVLRRAEGKDWAEIFDFVVVPPLADLEPDSAEFRVLRNLVSREMARVVEFARLAINGPQATGTLRPILSKLKLVHLG